MRFEDGLVQLSATSDQKTSRKILSDLRAYLDLLPPDVASREVQAFLSTSKDALTKLDMTVKPGGMLGDASSLRVFFLDYLGQADPAAAGKLAQQILNIPTSADEWAVSLRNYAWSNRSPEAYNYLRSKARQLIGNRQWQQNPSSGYLEAFDVIVYARGYELTPQLAELMEHRENRALAHAAYLTLDRLTINDPAAALTALGAQPELMKGRELTRANFFARADVRDLAQKSLLERYLLAPGRSVQELQTFSGIYPNANYMISNNLLTPTSTPTQAQLVAGDRAALEIIEEWLLDPRFSKLQSHLETVQRRLQTFVRQAAAPQAP